MLIPFKLLALGLTVLLTLAGCDRQVAPVFCDDRAGLLTSAQQERLYSYHRKLLDELDIHLLVTILDRAVLNLDREAVTLFEQYRVGATAKAARGVLLVVDPDGRQVRMEIGYDLEGIFPDGFVAMIEHEQMAPFFVAGRVAEGVEASVELLVARAMDSEVKGGVGQPVHERLSGGGGARIAVSIGAGQTDVPPAGNPAEIPPAASPQGALDGYLRVLAGRNKNPELALYTPETRAMLRKWLVTDAQQANEWQRLSISVSRGVWQAEGELAVVRFPLDDRQLPPYFFQRGPQGWMIDLAAMGQLIGFNHLNQWHFRHLDHRYMFAFRDVTFDSNGFPHPGR